MKDCLDSALPPSLLLRVHKTCPLIQPSPLGPWSPSSCTATLLKQCAVFNHSEQTKCHFKSKVDSEPVLMELQSFYVSKNTWFVMDFLGCSDIKISDFRLIT